MTVTSLIESDVITLALCPGHAHEGDDVTLYQ